jgi:hypothetical protein
VFVHAVPFTVRQGLEEIGLVIEKAVLQMHGRRSAACNGTAPVAIP